MKKTFRNTNWECNCKECSEDLCVYCEWAVVETIKHKDSFKCSWKSSFELCKTPEVLQLWIKSL